MHAADALDARRPTAYRAPAGVVALALVVATSCAPRSHTAEPRRTDGVTARRELLRFETVRSILEDSRGRYWFGSWNQGVARLDADGVAYFTAVDGLSDDQVRSIREDRRGVVWFECGVGLSGFDGEKLVRPARRDHASPDAWELATGDLWFKEDGAIGATAIEARPGAYRYDGTTFTYLAYPLPDDPDRRTAHATTCIATGKDGRVWFATYGAVIGYDGETFTILDDERLGLDDATGRLHVRCVFEDSRGDLWIGNNGIGVIRYDGRVATRFTQEMGLGKMGMHGGRTTPLPGDVTDGSPTMHRVFSIGEDRDGNVWFGTVESGAWRWDGRSLRNYTADDGLTTKDVLCVYTDRRGDLWLAGNGVFRFDGTSFERVH